MKVIIFSDSLGRPRPDLSDVNQRTCINDVYGELLKESYSETINVELIYIESLDSRDAIFWGERMVAFREPDVVFFHFGINDCAPRLFRKNSRSILLNKNFMKFTNNLFLKFASYFRYQITRYRKLVYIPVNDFIKNIETIETSVLLYSPNCEFYFLGIIGSLALNKKSYNYNKNIAVYNASLKNKYSKKFIDVENLVGNDKGLIEDNVHLNKGAHKIIFNKLKQIIGY